MKKLLLIPFIAIILYFGVTGFLPPPPTNGACDETLTFNLDSTTIRNLENNPIALLPAPGVGYHYQVSSVEGTVITHGVAFNRTILYTYLQDKQHSNGFCLMLQDTISKLTHCTTGWLNDYDLASNAGLFVTVDSIYNSSGNSEIKLQITFRVIADVGSTICDLSGFGSTCTDSIHLSSAQILNLHTTPIAIIAAPPAGFYVDVKSVKGVIYFGTAAYSGPTTLRIYEADTNHVIGTNTLLLSQTATGFMGFAIGSNNATYATATSVKISVQNGNTTTGDGSLTIWYEYQILPINQSTCVNGIVGPTGPMGLQGATGSTGNTDSAWVDYSATSFITGWTSYTLKNIRYQKCINKVHVTFSLAGTSNSTACSFTLPYASGVNSTTLNLLGLGQNNGVGGTKVYSLNTNTSTVVVSNSGTTTGAAWTATGTKQIYGEFVFETDN